MELTDLHVTFLASTCKEPEASGLYGRRVLYSHVTVAVCDCDAIASASS